ncbi:Coiled-coil domain-containing protein 22 [Orchesella cincta]|uniref:Coiled-coil domain-containing protein 22 homolog n=1 Tax=Orchesella cincta TaxID=48709 RepID=A0A1D2MTV2_ORCCI|nr:Coiled-coil domain-containing protein 22 [Orchesella cincta]
MEEVDGILIYTLKQIGCDVGSKISELSSQQLIQCVLSCLKLIRPDDSELPTYDSKMPMSVRFKVAQQIAQLLTDLGYTEEIECQSLLYPTESDARKVLIFAVEKLPRESEVANQIETLQRIAQETKNKEENEIDTEDALALGNGIEVDGIRLPSAVDINKLPKETLKFYASHLADLTFAKQREKYRKSSNKERTIDPVPIQTPVYDDDDFGDPDEPEGIVENETNSTSAETEKSKPVIAEKPKLKPPIAQKPSLVKTQIDEQPDINDKQREADDIAEKLRLLQEISKEKALRLHQRRDGLKELTLKINTLQDDVERLKEQLLDKEKQVDRQNKTHQLVNGDENGLEKVKNAIDAQVEKLMNRSVQWEQHRQPLIDQIRSKQQESFNGESDVARTREKIKSLKSQLKQMGQEAQTKEAVYTKLLAEYEKMSKDLSRSSYTRRITEIIGNIKKQKKEINKVLQDTKQIQKDINTLSGRLDRTFAVADELIYKDAEKDKDKSVAQSYKLLVAIHSDFSKIIKTLEEAGNLRRQSRDLEDKLELEKGKSVEDKLKRLRADLGQMQNENMILEARLRDPTIKRNQTCSS